MAIIVLNNKKQSYNWNYR